MAVVFKFRRDTTDLSLLAGAGSGWRAGTWNAKVGVPVHGRRPLPVTEAIDCLVDRGSHNDLGTSMQAMDDVREGAARYMADRQEQYPVWLHVKMNNETGERRALVREIAMEWLSAQVDMANEAGVNDARVRLKVEREGVWEGTATVAMPAATPTAAASVFYDYTASPGADVVGDRAARIAHFGFTVPSGAIGKIWVGVRSANKHGTVTNFVNIWECEDTDGTLGTDAGRTTDSTASPGGGGNTKVRVTPGTATWAKRLTVDLADYTANRSDQFGMFLWLLRCAATTGTWEVQVRWGYQGMADADFVAGPRVEVGTSWNYYEMGIAPIPLRDLQVLPLAVHAAAYEAGYTLQIWGRRTDGAGSLDLDCVCPVPVDEGFLSDEVEVIAGNVWAVAESPIGRVGRVVAYTSYYHVGAPKSFCNFGLPPGDGRMIVVYQRPASSVLTDQITLNDGNGGLYYCQWYNLRGSE